MSVASYNLFRGQLLGHNFRLALKALSIAEDAHNGVFRKDGKTPYIEHPVKVSSILYSAGVRDDKILAAAILHDVVEDTQVNGFTIFQEFSSMVEIEDHHDAEEIVEMVELLSKPKVYNNDNYYEVIRSKAATSIIKLADRVHNLSTVYNFSEEKKIKYIKETEDYVYPLIKYSQHHHPQYADVIRILDLWIESIVNNIKPYLEKGEETDGRS